MVEPSINCPQPLSTQGDDIVAWARAQSTAAAMVTEERTVFTHGIMAIPLGDFGLDIPEGVPMGAGYVRGIERLGVPPLTETDASLGVSWVMGLRGPEGATPLPAGLAIASTWNPELARMAGEVIGREAKCKGFNVLLAGGANIIREPRKGRAFEYLSEDPLLTGVLAGESIAGIQSNNMISTIKHFAVNAQETGRATIDSLISDSAARESDLLAFQIAIERGQPGAVMCGYNKVNGSWCAENDYLLNKVLKRDWGYRGFVMSDWGGAHSLQSALNGLDHQSGEQLDPEVYFSEKLLQAADGDLEYAERLRDMNRRILYAIYAHGLDRDPPIRRPIDEAAGLSVAGQIAEQGIVLLRNRNNILPLADSVKRIAVIGGYADTGVLSGGGSSQVHMTGGPTATVSAGGDGPFAAVMAETYQRSNPLQAIIAKAPHAQVVFSRGTYLSDAVRVAQSADIAIVFANGWRTEGEDVPDLSLPRGQDELIAAVSAANPQTVVVLQTGGPVEMPWLSRTAAVLQAWYPGGRGGEAIASILFGDANPCGRLPVTFPASLDQLPRPVLDGAEFPPDLFGRLPEGVELAVDYNIEGSDVGYRWNGLKGHQALFPFGFGLSYTSFEVSDLVVWNERATCLVTNTGERAGAEVVQLYLIKWPGGPKLRLVAFHRVYLEPGAAANVSLEIDKRLLATWAADGWRIAEGDYHFALGKDAESLSAESVINLQMQEF